jgi:tRNA-2-methylthio-N6-dimethylallyladenosine synthase
MYVLLTSRENIRTVQPQCNMSIKFFIKTFGCQMNKNDSSIIEHILTDRGYELVEDSDDADIFIINTCSVREHAETRALGYISTLKKWHQKDNRVLGVVGCMAERLADAIIENFSFVDIILGPDSYRKISMYVNEVYDRQTRIIDIALNKETYCGIYQHPKENTVSCFVSIMRGCENFCSYCVVPYVRGKIRSRPPDDIIREIEMLVSSGVKDITLLGQNVNEYSFNNVHFADLLGICANIPRVFRLRFLTSHPKDMDDETINIVKSHNTICEWFHLPLQSGNTRVLELMNRGYTKDEYLRLVDKIKKRIPEATITTDIIAGFPTETDEEFQETISVMEKVKFDDAYMYRYSPREGTRAYEYPSLPEHVIKSRLKQLIDFQNSIMIMRAREMIGRNYEVLFEGRAKNNATRGKTKGNKDVIVEKEITRGEVHQVLIREVRGRTPVGELIGFDKRSDYETCSTLY